MHRFEIIMPSATGRDDSAAVRRAIARMGSTGRRVVSVEALSDERGLRVEMTLTDRSRRAIRDAHGVFDLIVYDALGQRGVEAVGAFVEGPRAVGQMPVWNQSARTRQPR